MMFLRHMQRSKETIVYTVDKMDVLHLVDLLHEIVTQRRGVESLPDPTASDRRMIGDLLRAEKELNTILKTLGKKRVSDGN